MRLGAEIPEHAVLRLECGALYFAAMGVFVGEVSTRTAVEVW